MPESQELSQLGVRRIAQQLFAPDDDRCLLGGHSQPMDERLRFLVLFEVDESVRQAIARDELAQSTGITRET